MDGLDRGGEKGEKIVPNAFGGSVAFKVIAQNFVDDQLVMKIETDDLAEAMKQIRDENDGKSVSEMAGESKPSQNIYIIKVS